MTIGALVLWLWGTARLDPSAMSDAGLVSVLGWQFPVSFALLAGAFAMCVRHRDRRPLLVLQTILLVVMIQGITPLVEPHPAYFTAYLHVGFVDEIIRNGHTVPELDARFNWPGSFAFAALVSAAGGEDSAMSLVRWAPVAFNLAFLAPLWMIAKALRTDHAGRWIALWVFVAANWVHQDYLAPQAEAYFLYLVVVGLVLRYLGGEGTHWTAKRSPFVPELVLDRLRRLQDLDGARRREAAGSVVDPRTTRFLLWSIVAVCATTVVSHQLTPFALIAVVGVLVLVGACRAVHLPVIIAVLFVGWFSVGAVTWWSSHLGELVSGFGQFGDNASSGLLARLGGSDLRAVVLWLRVAFSAVMLGGAMVLAGFRWRAGKPPVAALALLLPPFLLVGGQSYGGEVLLRSYLFALPAASILLAQGLSAAARRRATAAGVMVLGGVLTVAAMAGLTVRFGNEHFERVTDDDLAAVSWVYENVPPGTVLVAPTRNLPWRYRDLTSYRYEPLDEQPLDSTDKVLALIPDDGNAYLISTPAQQQFGEQLAFLPSGWLTSITAELVDAGVATEVFRQGDAAVYRLDAGPKP
ncbi:MAG: hypothetical protein IPG97_10665 [Microthrixaceae bacterium]|jgi:hypothetical protein|nr:hypothetical protein [Microthrixaceae bacterium]